MKAVAHLFGNWKWTGPAEPAVNLAASCRRPTRLFLGHCPYPDLGHQVEAKARARGLQPTVLRSLRKHWNPLRVSRAAAELGRALETVPALFHTHLDADHAVVARLSATLEPAPLRIRSVHSVGPYAARTRRLLHADAELVLSSTPGLARGIEAEARLAPHAVGVLEPSVDLDRFQPRPGQRERGRQRLGLGEHDFAVGIVARIQSHRRFDLLLDTWQLLKNTPRPPRLIVLGRGTQQEELLHRPVRERGLESLVVHPGYQEGQDYVDALAACDAGCFLVPGTDVACRAVREWLAMGRGVLATRRDPLPEILRHGEDGELLPEDPVAWAAALRDPRGRERFQRLGENARRRAQSSLSHEHAATVLEQFYVSAELARPGALLTPGLLPAGRGGVLAVAPPGMLHEARRFAVERGLDPDRVTLLNPWTSRDAVLDCMAAVHALGPEAALLVPHPEWDRPFLAELRRRVGVTGLSLDEPRDAEENFRLRLFPELYRPERAEAASA